MNVRNMTSDNGNTVPNQFIIEDREYIWFQSYSSMIARKTRGGGVVLDENYWDYSVTTGRYRNQFLGETIKETRAKIKSGEYTLVNLN